MTRHTVLSIALLAAAALSLRAQINTPKTGFIRAPDGSVHAVLGIPANYIVDGKVLASADAVSFSDNGGLVAKNGRILLLNSAMKTLAEYDSGETAPLLNLDGGLKTAIAWLPSQHALLHWDGTSLVITQVNGAGVLGSASSLRALNANTVKLLATNADKSVSEATISLDSGEVISVNLLPGIRGPAFYQQSLIVFGDNHGLAVANSTTVLMNFPLPASDVTFERMSSNSLHISSTGSGKSWVLRFANSNSAQLSQLSDEAALSSIANLQEGQ